MKLSLIGLISLLVFSVIPLAQAAIIPNGDTTNDTTDQVGVEPLPETTLTTPEEIITLIKDITKYIFYGVMAIAVMFIVLSAFNFLTAGGSPEKIATARQMLIYAIIGIAVALLAYAIPFIVRGILAM